MGNVDARNEYAVAQQTWKNVLGVNVHVEDIDQSKLITQRNDAVNNPNGMQMWALYWGADYPDPQDWLTLIFGKGSSKNGLNYGQNKTSFAAEQQANQQSMIQADGNQDQASRLQHSCQRCGVDTTISRHERLCTQTLYCWYHRQRAKLYPTGRLGRHIRLYSHAMCRCHAV